MNGRIVAARGLRGFADGFVSVVLPSYLALLGFSALEIGALATSALLGSALLTLGVGLFGSRFTSRQVLLGACALMIATGIVPSPTWSRAVSARPFTSGIPIVSKYIGPTWL